jgi:hypothetical protein
VHTPSQTAQLSKSSAHVSNSASVVCAGFGDHGGQQASFEDPGRPQGLSQIVVVADLASQRTQGGNGHAVGLFGAQTEMGHTGYGGRIPQIGQSGQDVCKLHRALSCRAYQG